MEQHNPANPRTGHDHVRDLKAHAYREGSKRSWRAPPSNRAVDRIAARVHSDHALIGYRAYAAARGSLGSTRA